MKSRGLFTVLAVVIIVVVCYVGYAFFYAPLWQENADLRAQVEKDSVRLVTLQELYRQSGKLEVKKSIYEERLALLQKLLPPSTDASVFMVEMEQLAKADGVSISSLTIPGAPTLVDPDTVASFPLNVSGDYFHVMSFLRHLLNFPQIVNVTGISMQPGTDGTISANMSCIIYLRPGGG
jgi:Tfp pilus assembly protein PilO